MFKRLLTGPVLLFVAGLLLSAGGDLTMADESKRLHELFEREWQRGLEDSPVFASQSGDDRWGDKWRDLSLTAFDRREQEDKKLLAELDTFDLSALSPEDQLNYRLFRKQIENDIEAAPFRLYLFAVNQRGGVQTMHDVASSLRFRTVRDYENWIGRLNAFPVVVDQTIALLREGARVGMVHPSIIMDRLTDQINAQLVDSPSASLFYAPFNRFPVDIDNAERQKLTQAGQQAINDAIIPSFKKFRSFFVEEYLPACTERSGAWQMPEGQALYAQRARSFTTTTMTPDEIHEIGLAEVSRIRAQMKVIMEKVEFKGSFQDFLEFLRTDPQFYHTDPQALLQDYRALTRKIDPTLVKLFKTIPRIPYGVEPIPDSFAPDTTTAYYRRPAADGSRAGTYFVNLYKPEVRPTYEMEALSLHEGVPGHHFQIALSMELGDLPAFRRYTGYTAFTEGWGLYAESLGDELGFYKDPYSKFGQLTYEMWRAVRLVVDTGIHSKKWTRQQAIDFFKENAAKTEYDIINEIDRYIVWPGQALAYKIGELKIKELRARGEETLGDDFDVRQFHEIVLSSGAVPLDVLEDNVDTWIATRQKTAKD